MLVSSLTNISSGSVTVVLSNGNSIDLPSGGQLVNVDVINLAGIQNLLRITYPLHD